MRGFAGKCSSKNRVQIPPAPPNKPLIFLEKIRGFSLGVEKGSNTEPSHLALATLKERLAYRAQGNSNEAISTRHPLAMQRF